MVSLRGSVDVMDDASVMIVWSMLFIMSALFIMYLLMQRVRMWHKVRSQCLPLWLNQEQRRITMTLEDTHQELPQAEHDEQQQLTMNLENKHQELLAAQYVREQESRQDDESHMELCMREERLQHEENERLLLKSLFDEVVGQFDHVKRDVEFMLEESIGADYSQAEVLGDSHRKNIMTLVVSMEEIKSLQIGINSESEDSRSSCSSLLESKNRLLNAQKRLDDLMSACKTAFVDLVVAREKQEADAKLQGTTDQKAYEKGMVEKKVEIASMKSIMKIQQKTGLQDTAVRSLCFSPDVPLSSDCIAPKRSRNRSRRSRVVRKTRFERTHLQFGEFPDGEEEALDLLLLEARQNAVQNKI